MFFVVLPPVVIKKPYIKENRPRLFYQVACVVSGAMTREKTHDIWKIVKIQRYDR